MSTLSYDEKSSVLTELANIYMVLGGIQSFLQQEVIINKRIKNTTVLEDNRKAQSILSTAIRDLNIEIEELRIRQTIDWLGTYSTLKDEINGSRNDIQKHLEEIQNAGSKAQTAAKVLSAALEVIKLIAPLV